VSVSDTHERLLHHLRQALRANSTGAQPVVIMNDFSLDHLVEVADYGAFQARASEVLAQKGGILLAGRQLLQQGGCAANTATTLARLGVPTHFICRTSPLGRVLLDFFLGRAGVELSHVKEDGTLAVMAALEVGAGPTNIMINDLTSFSPFGFDDLDESDLQLIEGATLVGMFDWCLNRRGTHLAAGLLDHVAAHPGCAHLITYLDTSDPAPRRDEMAELRTQVLQHPRLNLLAINENELRHYAGALNAADSFESLAALAVGLSGELPATICAHTAAFALEVDKSPTGTADAPRLWHAPSYHVAPRRMTGAGDTWNGGNILGLLLGLPPDERLLLANAVAACYIAAAEPERPTLPQLIDFIAQHPPSADANQAAS
jgi:sugar/nucleoside kinase (ribokinase family)